MQPRIDPFTRGALLALVLMAGILLMALGNHVIQSWTDAPALLRAQSLTLLAVLSYSLGILAIAIRGMLRTSPLTHRLMKTGCSFLVASVVFISSDAILRSPAFVVHDAVTSIWPVSRYVLVNQSVSPSGAHAVNVFEEYSSKTEPGRRVVRVASGTEAFHPMSGGLVIDLAGNPSVKATWVSESRVSIIAYCARSTDASASFGTTTRVWEGITIELAVLPLGRQRSQSRLA